MTGTDRAYEIRLTAILGITFGFVFFDRNALNYLLPFILKDIPLSNAQIGAIAALLALSWSISGYFVGWLSDRIGKRKPLLVAAVICFSLASVLTGLAGSFAILLFARLIMGLADGPVLPISQTLMALASSPERRGLNMGLMQNVLSNLLGSLVAPLVMVSIATAYGWRSAFYLTIIPGLIIAALIFFFVREPGQPVAAGDGPTEGDRPGIVEILRNRNIALCLVISGLMVGWMIVGWVFLPVYLTSVAHFSPGQMSVIMSALGISGAIAGFAVPGLSDRFGRRPVMLVFCAIGALAPLSALIFTGNMILLATILAIGWIAGGTFSLFMATIPAESAPTAQVATAMALIMGAGELIGGSAAPLIVGWLSDIYGLQTPLIAEIVLALCAAILTLFLRETAPAKAGQAPEIAPLPFA